MKIAIIAANNIYVSPYIFFYTHLLESMRIEYELIIPDRHGAEETFNGIVHKLPWNKKRPTVLNYILYSRAVHKLVTKSNYSGLVVLTTNNAAFFSVWLLKKFNAKYIVDIRDYTHENIKPFFWLEGLAVNHSAVNVISSERFKKFLPKADYAIVHNLPKYAEAKNRFIKKKEGPIVLGYVGAIGYVEQCKKLMDLVKNDSRFAFVFYGTSEYEHQLRTYAKNLSCDRIRFHGRYNNTEKMEIIRNIDILFNAYGDGNPLLDYALSNKLYDAMVCKKPILTSPRTYMDELGGLLSYPIDLQTEENLDALYDWYMNLPEEEVEGFADQMMQKFTEENAHTEQMIRKKLLEILEIEC